MTPVEWGYVAGVCYVGIEYWLGKTNKVKAGSTLELVLNGVKTVCSVFMRKQP
jgi:hypothetical protein